MITSNKIAVYSLGLLGVLNVGASIYGYVNIEPAVEFDAYAAAGLALIMLILCFLGFLEMFLAYYLNKKKTWALILSLLISSIGIYFFLIDGIEHPVEIYNLILLGPAVLGLLFSIKWKKVRRYVITRFQA